jgi:hypothetical protein
VPTGSVEVAGLNVSVALGRPDDTAPSSPEQNCLNYGWQQAKHASQHRCDDRRRRILVEG